MGMAEVTAGDGVLHAWIGIKISIDRLNISGSPDERDVFGAQQQSAIENLTVPVYAQALAKASAL